jgi:hypothetical protein
MVAEKSGRRALLRNSVRLKKRHGEYCWLEQGAGKISSPNGDPESAVLPLDDPPVDHQNIQPLIQSQGESWLDLLRPLTGFRRLTGLLQSQGASWLEAACELTLAGFRPGSFTSKKVSVLRSLSCACGTPEPVFPDGNCYPRSDFLSFLSKACARWESG